MINTDIGAYISAKYGAVGSLTAGGAGDNTEVDGEWVDRRGYHSCVVLLLFKATLAAAATLTLSGNLQDASDSSGTGSADFGTAYAATVVATGPGGGGTVTGVVALSFNLRMAGPYVRFQHTPNLSASGTDTAVVGHVIIRGGAEALPA